MLGYIQVLRFMWPKSWGKQSWTESYMRTNLIKASPRSQNCFVDMTLTELAILQETVRCHAGDSYNVPEKKKNTSLTKDVTYNARIQNLITLRLLWEVKSQFVFLLLLLAVYWYTPETVQTRLGSPEPPLRQDLFLFLLQGFHIFGWV